MSIDLNQPEAWTGRLRTLEKWVRWHAWVSWGLAGLMALTIVGLLAAWLPAWAAWELQQSVRQLRQLQAQLTQPHPSFDTGPLQQFCRHLGRQFVLTALFSLVTLLTLVGLVTWAVATGRAPSPF